MSGQFGNDRTLLPHISSAEAFQRAFAVSRETTNRLSTYAALLEKWQKTINLVAPSTVGDVWHRHLADSAQILALADQTGGTWVDLGSGAGFPGLVLALMRCDLGPGRAVLVESDSRKCAFLAEVCRQTRIPAGFTVEILNQRIENPSTQAKIGSADVVTARALAALDRLLGLVEPILGEKSVALLQKGRDSAQELAAAQVSWSFDVESIASLTDAEAVILAIRHVRKLGKDR